MSNRTRLCLQPWNTINVGADGTVYPCCVTVDDMNIGNLAEQSLEEIIVGPKMAEIRNRLVSGNLTGACVDCQNAGPTTVKAFERTLNLYLSSTASENGRRDRLVMTPSEEQELHAVGTLKISLLPGKSDDDAIEVYSDFSPGAYLEGELHLGSDCTIGLWVKRSAASQTGVILHNAAYNAGSWAGPVLEVTADPTGRLQVVLSPEGYQQPHVLVAEACPVEEWTHVGLTKQNDLASLYVNGTLVSAQPTFPDSLDSQDAVMRVGVNAAPGRGSSFLGSIAGLFVENECLSAEDIRVVYEAEIPAFT